MVPLFGSTDTGSVSLPKQDPRMLQVKVVASFTPATACLGIIGSERILFHKNQLKMVNFEKLH